MERSRLLTTPSITAFLPEDHISTIVRVGTEQHDEVELVFVSPATDERTFLTFREGDLADFVLPFRQCYLHSDDCEVGKVRNLLSRHAAARESDLGDVTVDDLRKAKAGYQQALKEAPDATLIEVVPGEGVARATAKDVIDTWLNGQAAHFNREAARETSGPDRALYALTFAISAEHVARQMLHLGLLVRAILAEPALRTPNGL